MAWCLQAPNHYCLQCWTSYMSAYGVTRQQWVKYMLFFYCCKHHSSTCTGIWRTSWPASRVTVAPQVAVTWHQFYTWWSRPAWRTNTERDGVWVYRPWENEDPVTSQDWLNAPVISSPLGIRARKQYAWWHHQMGTLSALLAFCAGNSPVNSPHNGQWRGALMFSLICAWINGWINNREDGDLRRHRTHYDVIVMV